MYKGICWQEDWPSKNTSSVCTQEQEDTHRGCAGRDVYVRSIGTGGGEEMGKGWSWLGVSKQEPLARKSTTSVQASSHMSRQPRSTNLTPEHPPPQCFFHFCFRFQCHWDSFRYLARLRVYTLSRMAILPFPTHPLFRLFLYISFRI